MKRKDLGIAAGGAAAAAIVVIAAYEIEHRFPEGERSRHEQPNNAIASSSGSAELGPRTGKALERSHASEELARDIAGLNKRLYGIEKEKTKVQAQLARAERELARQSEGRAAGARHEFDLDEQDWRGLAKDGAIKYRRPCLEEKGWKPRAEELELLGLRADDGETLRAAFRRSYDRIWKTVRPLCARVISDADVVDSLGPDTCIHVVVDSARRQDSALSDEAIRQVAETRAGQRALPPPGAMLHPVFQMFWMLTGEMRAFEADLAESFGPDEAKRVAYAKALCHGHSTFGRAGPSKLDQ